MTLDYASPEQVRGEAIPATDVYSLGVLSRLLTTKMPYGSETQSVLDIQTAIRDREPVRPSQVILTDTSTAILRRRRSWKWWMKLARRHGSV